MNIHALREDSGSLETTGLYCRQAALEYDLNRPPIVLLQMIPPSLCGTNREAVDPRMHEAREGNRTSKGGDKSMSIIYYMYMANPFNAEKYSNKNFPDADGLPDDLRDRLLKSPLVKKSKEIWCGEENKIYLDRYFGIGASDNPHARRAKQIRIAPKYVSRYAFYNGGALDAIRGVKCEAISDDVSRLISLPKNILITKTKKLLDIGRVAPSSVQKPYYPSLFIGKAFYEYMDSRANVVLPKAVCSAGYGGKTYYHVRISEDDLIYATANALSGIIGRAGKELFLNISGPSCIQYDKSIEEQMKAISGMSSILGFAGIIINKKKYRFDNMSIMLSSAVVNEYIEYKARGMNLSDSVKNGYIPMFGGPNEECFGFDLRKLTVEQLKLGQRERTVIV